MKEKPISNVLLSGKEWEQLRKTERRGLKDRLIETLERQKYPADDDTEQKWLDHNETLDLAITCVKKQR